MSGNELRFLVSFGVALVAFALTARWYLWPALSTRQPRVALSPLLLYACLRINGLMFLMPGLVSPELPEPFARPVAYGDVTAAFLALLALLALRHEFRVAIPAVWLFNVVGIADLLYANVSTVRDRVEPTSLGVAYYLAAVNVPAMMVVHVVIFIYLLRPSSSKRPFRPAAGSSPPVGEAEQRL